MHCVSGSETWGRSGSLCCEAIAVAHPQNLPQTSGFFVQCAYVARSYVIGTLPANDRAAMDTVSGGVGVLMSDDANARGLAVPEMPEDFPRRPLR